MRRTIRYTRDVGGPFGTELTITAVQALSSSRRQVQASPEFLRELNVTLPGDTLVAAASSFVRLSPRRWYRVESGTPPNAESLKLSTTRAESFASEYRSKKGS